MHHANCNAHATHYSETILRCKNGVDCRSNSEARAHTNGTLHTASSCIFDIYVTERSVNGLAFRKCYALLLLLVFAVRGPRVRDRKAL